MVFFSLFLYYRRTCNCLLSIIQSRYCDYKIKVKSGSCLWIDSLLCAPWSACTWVSLRNPGNSVVFGHPHGSLVLVHVQSLYFPLSLGSYSPFHRWNHLNPLSISLFECICLVFYALSFMRSWFRPGSQYDASTASVVSVTEKCLFPPVKLHLWR